MKQFMFTLTCILFWILGLKAQLTFKVTGLPKNSASKMELFVAGTFNNWSPGDQQSKMTKNAEGHYILTINPPQGEVRYKFTRGSWATVEGNVDGQFRPDRVIQYDGKEKTIFCNIVNWEGSSAGSKKSTRTPNVITLHQFFKMPQLNRSRKVSLYLPPDYYDTDKSYPVIYLHDGQNMFDEVSSFSGEWKVDESLNEYFERTGNGFIAVAIDNGAQYRFDEYSAWRNVRFGGGEGAQYVTFIAETLKPFIDQNFRTLTDRNNTAILGSSMGGLISQFAITERPDIFGKAGVLSPSFWFTDQAFWHVVRKGKQQDVKVFMIGGTTEGSNMVGNMLAMKRTMLAVGFDNSEVYLDAHADGKHSEWYWSREFLDAVRWLFPSSNNRSAKKTTNEEKEDFPIMISSSSDGNQYSLKSNGPLSKKTKFIIYDGEGTLIQKAKKLKLSIISDSNSEGSFKLKSFGNGEYFLHLLDENDKLLLVKKL